MNRNMLIAIVIISIVSLGAIATYTYLNQNAASMTVIFYDEDGNEVFSDSTGIDLSIPHIFQNYEGKKVTTVQVIVKYSASYTGDTPTSINVVTQLTADIYRCLQADVLYDTITTDPQTTTKVQNIYTYTFDIADDLIPEPNPDSEDVADWGIVFTVDFAATATYEDGSTLDATDSIQSDVYNLMWSEVSNTLTIEGTFDSLDSS